MICGMPRRQGAVQVLSACDSVWEPIRELPAPLKDVLTDDLGNRGVEYGGFVFIEDTRLVERISEAGWFTCVRALRWKDLDKLDTPLAKSVVEFGDLLVHIGWDIVHGNGWVSASCDGIFPLDVCSLTSSLMPSEVANQFGLLSSEATAVAYCEINNKDVARLAPWYPVAVHVDRFSLRRLSPSHGEAA